MLWPQRDDNSRFGADPELCHALKHMAGMELTPLLCTMAMAAGMGWRQSSRPQTVACTGSSTPRDRVFKDSRACLRSQVIKTQDIGFCWMTLRQHPHPGHSNPTSCITGGSTTSTWATDHTAEKAAEGNFSLHICTIAELQLSLFSMPQSSAPYTTSEVSPWSGLMVQSVVPSSSHPSSSSPCACSPLTLHLHKPIYTPTWEKALSFPPLHSFFFFLNVLFLGYREKSTHRRLQQTLAHEIGSRRAWTEGRGSALPSFGNSMLLAGLPSPSCRLCLPPTPPFHGMTSSVINIQQTRAKRVHTSSYLVTLPTNLRRL